MTAQCPVCLLPADFARDRDYGDKEQIRCPRCGQFEISGTALAMLDSRLAVDVLARARLSHAIRSKTSEDRWAFVSSTNLDEMSQQSLPSLPQQLQHLLLWLAAQLGDDKLGRVPMPWPDSLAGIIGAVDGERVTRLISYAVKEGVIERGGEDTWGLSPEGWKMIAPPEEEKETDKQESSEEACVEFVKAHCNECGGVRNAYKQASHRVEGSDGEVSWANTYDILECCGCNGVAVRHTFWFSEWDYVDENPITGEPRLVPGLKETYWPPQTKRKKPDWVENLGDDVLRVVSDEVYHCLNSGMIVLASIGTRTLLDRAMLLRVGDPKGGFAGKLNLMVERGHIGKDERGILEAITDAGSAAAHRGFVPQAAMLATIIDTTENFLHREFVLKTAAGDVRTATPKREQ